MGQDTAVCVRLLNQTFAKQSYSNIALDAALRDSSLTPAEKRRCAALYYGVIERKLTLDHVIATYSKKPLAKLDLPVCNVLRCGVYKLLYMRIPDNAAVNECVALVKKLRFASAAGFVNFTLRQFLRDQKSIAYPKEKFAAWSVRDSAPIWLIRKLCAEYGEEAAQSLLSDAVGKPPITLRRNPLCGTTEAFLASLGKLEVTAHPLIPDCYSVAGGDVTAVPGFAQGRFHVQDLASQLCCMAVGAQPGETVLDLCAAPGGKSFTIAEHMNGQGTVYAFDLHENRVKLIASGAKRLRLSNVCATVGDATVWNDALPMADRILCDVPCSGIGVIRRKPEIKYKPEGEADGLPAIQARILETAARYLKVGGTLLYSTCTLSRAENDDVVDAFLAAHPNFVGVPYLETLGEPFGGWKTTLLPSQLGSDGFFLAKLKRME